MSLGVKYSPEGLDHYMRILQLIAYKIFFPEIQESSFVTAVANEDWGRAEAFADTRNKEAFSIGLFQKFVEYVKKSPKYIEKHREDKLNQILS